MKKIFGIIALLISFSSISFAQESKDIATEKVHVSGNCGDCKKRIEKAAFVPGVKRAEWDVDSKVLTVTYRPSKTSINQIETSIAKVGYDAGDVKASDDSYKKLPKCCAYKDEGAEKHQH